jgi:hypothetical protein
MAAACITRLSVVTAVSGSSSGNVVVGGRDVSGQCSSRRLVGLSSFRQLRGQGLVVSRRPDVVGVRRSVQVRADQQQPNIGEKVQEIGQDLSDKAQGAADQLKNTFTGAQNDAQSRANQATNVSQKKLDEGSKDAQNLGAQIGNQAENFKVKKSLDMYYICIWSLAFGYSQNL